MNVGVAIHATTRQCDFSPAGASVVLKAWQIPPVTGGFVTLLAQKRSPGLEQPGGRRTVRRMADRAVLGHRLMIPEKRSALFDVTLEAGFIDRITGQKLHPGRAVRIVAVAASHLAFGRRMTRGPKKLGSLLLVTSDTNVVLRALVSHPILSGVDLVTGRTGHVPLSVGTALPVNPLARLMTVQTDGIALRHRRICTFTRNAEIPINPLIGRHRQQLAAIGQAGLGTFVLPAWFIDMGLALAMTINTGRRAPIRSGAVPGLANRQHRISLRFVVAGRANAVTLEYNVRRHRLFEAGLSRLSRRKKRHRENHC